MVAERSIQTNRRLSLTRRRAASIHRWLGLLLCVFWLLQATTGMLSVFHWELEDATISSAWKPTNLQAIQTRLTALAPQGSGKQITMMWTTAGLPDRYDVWMKDRDRLPTRVVRIAGDGTILRAKDAGSADFFGRVVELHQTMLMGERGRWLTGLSGIVLIASVLLGIRTAWPAAGRWRTALWPRGGKSQHAQIFGWHRALGLMFAVPALLLFSTGAALAYKGGIAFFLGAHPPVLASKPRAGPPADIGFARAVGTALDAARARSLTAVQLPTAEDATYRIQVLAPGDVHRAYGTTTVFVDEASGTIRGIFPAASQPLRQQFMDGLYAVHTGEIGWLPGRLLVLAVGLWLATMAILGIWLWRIRKRARSAKRIPLS